MPNLKGIAYDIKQGETLLTVARNHGVDYRELINTLRKNDLRDFDIKETRFNEKQRLLNSMTLFEEREMVTSQSRYVPYEISEKIMR